METVTSNLYEGMFLVDSTEAESDWEGVTNAIKEILSRCDVELVSFKKWDEKRLAYEIGGKNRGTYILTYFKVEGPRIADIERMVQLSEKIMRVLVLKTDAMTNEDVEKQTPTEIGERREKEREAKIQEQIKAAEQVEKKAEKKTDEGAEEVLQQEKNEEVKQTEKAPVDAEPTPDEEAGQQDAKNIESPGQSEQTEASPEDENKPE